MNLDLTTKTLEVKLAGAITTNQLTWVAHYVDINQSTVAVTAIAEVDGVTNNTSNVTMVSAPAANVTRQVKEFTVENTDTTTATVTIQLNDNGTRQPVVVITLPANSTLVFANGNFSVVPTSTSTPVPGSFTVTTTGNIDNLNFNNAAVIRMNNATLATIRGLLAGNDGQQVTIVSVGAGQVDLANQNSNSTAANRLINSISSLNTSLAPGVGFATYEYDATTARWRLINHTQGAAISYTPSWSASVTNPAIGNGTLAGNYVVRGTFVQFIINMTAGSTTTFGSGFWVFSTPSSIAPSGLTTAYVGIAIDNDGGNAGLTISYIASLGGGLFGVVDDGSANLDASDPFTWATSDVLRISAEFQVT